jgi:MYXO-CTERM domain-containing protein
MLLGIALDPAPGRERGRVWITDTYRAVVSRDGGLVVHVGDEQLDARTRGIERGGQRWADATSGRRDGAITRDWGVAVETLRRTPAGVAQAWEVAHEPDGDGPLSVHIDVTASVAGRARGHGVRFGALAYGAATWIEADGRRTTLEQRLDGNTITITVPEQLVEESAYPAVLDPVIGPESGVDDPVLEPQVGAQQWPAVAFDGTNYLVAWRDFSEGAVTVARLDGTGAPLDGFGTKLEALNTGEPDVVFDGTNFVVAWATGSEIMIARVAPDGTVLDEPAIEAYATTGTGVVTGARIAYGAGRYLVAAHEIAQIGASPAKGYLFDETFQLLNQPDFLRDGSGSGGFTDVVFDGQQFVAAFEWHIPFANPPEGSIGGVLIDPADGTQTPLSDLIADATAHVTYRRPALTAVDGGTLVAWSDERNLDVDVYARRILSSGALEAEQPAAQTADDDQLPLLTGRGDTALVAFRQAGATVCSTCSVVVSADGALQSSISDMGVDFDEAAMAGSTNVTVLAHGLDDDIFTATLDASGVSSGALTLLSVQANRQTASRIALGGEENLVVWRDERGPTPELRGARVDATGAPTAPSEVIASLADVNTPTMLASNGERWLVGWAGGSGTEVVAVPPLAGGTPNVIDGGLGGPSLLAHDGDTFLLFTEYAIGLCRGVCIFNEIIETSRLDDDGALIETLDPIDPLQKSLRPAAVGVGDAALVAWESVENDADQGDIGITLIPHGEQPAPPFMLTTALGKQASPAVAFDGEQVLVVWEDRSTGGSEIRGARLLPDGTVVDDEPLLISTALESTDPEVVWTDDGHSFLVTWLGSAAGAPPEVYGAWVTRDGEVLDFPGVPLTSSESPIASHQLAAQGAGNVILTFERYVDDLRSERVRTRLISSGELDGGTCIADEDCASRLCEDDACCPVACGTCETCNGDMPGTCTPVTSSDDDSCFGTVTCDEGGECKKAPGQPCDAADECASGFCIEGLCCDTACDGVCDSCVVNPGTCVSKDCGAYSCNEDKSCRSECNDSTECAEGFQCTAERTCEAEQTAALVEQGCACSVIGERRRSGWWLAAAMLGLALSRRRRA